MIERFAFHDALPGDTDASRDALTDALDRRGLAALIGRIARSTRRGQNVTLLMADVDGLAAVDALYDDDAGDEARKMIARRLRLFVAPHDSVARVAKNVFARILCHDGGAPVAIGVAKEMLATIAWPIDVPGGTAALRGAIGIATMPTDAPTAERLFATARVAMEWVMARGHDGHCVYEAGMAETGFCEAIRTDSDLPHLADRRAARAIERGARSRVA